MDRSAEKKGNNPASAQYGNTTYLPDSGRTSINNKNINKKFSSIVPQTNAASTFPKVSMSRGPNSSIGKVSSKGKARSNRETSSSRNNLFAAAEIPSPVVPTHSVDLRDPSSILRLPRKVRLRIWNYLSLRDNLSLRLTCRLVRVDIDHFVGVKAEIDDSDESFPYLIRLGLQHAVILGMSTPTASTRTLPYPELLKFLVILGGISSSIFSKLMKDCQNLRSLRIQFSKDLYALQPKLFPVVLPKSSPRILPNLKVLEFQAITKNDFELKYVSNTFFGLVGSHLLKKTHLSSLKVTIVHKLPNDALETCSELMAILVSDNALNLKELQVDIKVPQSLLPTPESAGQPWNQEESEVTQVSNLLGFFYDKRRPGSKQPAWKEFPLLHSLTLSLSLKDFQSHWSSIPYQTNHLSSLYCEIPAANSWLIYKNFIQGNESTLESVVLEATYDFPKESSTKPRQMDLGIFRKCSKLQSLFISQSVHPAIRNSEITNIGKLPRSIEEAEFSYLLFSPFQIFRLIKSFNLRRLRLSYSTRSDCNFGQLLWLLKWVYSCNSTQLEEFVIVDLKIRFQSNPRRLRDLVENQYNLETEYFDFNETMLVLRRD